MLDQFNKNIELMAKANGGSYIDALVDYAEEKGMKEFEDLIPMLHPILLEKVKVEFIKKNYFPAKKIECSLSEFM